MELSTAFVRTLTAPAFLLLAIHASPEMHATEAAKNEPDRLVAVLEPTAGNDARGTVTFEKVGDSQIRVTAEVSGLEPGSRHGFHIHEYGDLRAEDGTSAGGHYNPEGHPHALPDENTRHAGDLGNLEADDNGEAHYTVTVENLSLTGARNPIIGRGLVVHEERDDGSQPTGDAGARIAVGVIGVMNEDVAP